MNIHSDSSFCKETIEKFGKQDDTITLIADDAYGSIKNVKLAAKSNIDLVTTALIGKTPKIIQSEFEINEATNKVVKCPSGKTPYKTSYLKKLSTEEYMALQKKRNCVEDLPSVSRHKYQVDTMPIRGLVHSKTWFYFKIGAINVKKVLKIAA